MQRVHFLGAHLVGFPDVAHRDERARVVRARSYGLHDAAAEEMSVWRRSFSCSRFRWRYRASWFGVSHSNRL